MRAGHAGAVGAVFLRARCCSTALAAIAWARARILNSWSPKRGASSVVARLARLAGGIGLADFDGGQQGVAAQLVVVVEVLVTEGQGVDPLGDQFLGGMFDELGVAMIGAAGGELVEDAGELLGL